MSPFAPFARRLRHTLLTMLVASTVAGCRWSSQHPDFEVKVSGHGRPVIFIPGVAVPGEVWQSTVDALSDGCQCHVLTLAGFGGVKPTGTDPFLPRVRDELIGYIRDNHLDHPVIVGHSMGGLMALWVAETAPEIPGRLVVVDALPDMAAILYPDVPPASIRQKIAENVATVQHCTPAELAARQHIMMSSWVTSPDVAAKLAAETSRSDPPTVGRAMGEMMSADLYPDLTKIVCPTLVMISLADKAVHSTPEQVTQSFQRQYRPLAGVRFTVFDRARHFIMLDDPQGFQKALARELADGRK